MRKIVLFICSLSSGGAEHQLVELARQLSAFKYDVSIVTFADEKDHYEVPKNVRRLHLGEGRSRFVKLLIVFRYFLRKRSDECVISFGQRENCLCLIPLFVNRRPKVISGERNNTVGKPSIYEKLLMRFLYRRSDYIVPNSYSQRFYILNKHPDWENKVKTIINYTDLSKFRVDDYTCNPIVNIGVFGRYHFQKNCLRFADAVKELKDRSDVPFVINWFGNISFKDCTPNAYYLKLKEKIRQSDIQDVFVLHDHVRDVIGLMPEFDAICLPSLWEGFSNSIAEAICCGRPVLVSDVSDNPVMVHDGVNGYLFNPSDENNMADVLLRFLNLSQSEKQRMSIKGREIAETLFGGNVFIDSYIQLIES